MSLRYLLMIVRQNAAPAPLSTERTEPDSCSVDRENPRASSTEVKAPTADKGFVAPRPV